MARFSDPDEARAYLNSLSDHPDRPGDTSKLNPQFALSMANAIDQARAAGMPVRLLSGQREGSVTGSAYDKAGYSSHIYGLASDVEGIGAAGSDTAAQWRKIAEANGLNSPYNPNGSEWNHWQVGPKLETSPALLNNLKSAYASGDMTKVWAAASPVTGGTETASAQPFASYKVAGAVQPPPSSSMSPAMSHEQFIRDYATKIGIDPDQAVAIAKAEGLNATGFRTPNQASTVDVTNGQPWSFGDYQLNVRNGMGADALKAGIDPRDPKQWQAADQFALDQMRAHGVGAWSNPVARNIAAHGGITLNTPQPGALGIPHTVTPSTAGAPYTQGAVAAANSAPAPAPAPAAATAPPSPTFGEAIGKGDVGGALAAINRPTTTTSTDAKGNTTTTTGATPLEKIAGAFGGKDDGSRAAPEIPALPTMTPVQDPNAGLAPAAQQLFQTVSANAAKPLTWNARPYGYNAGFQGTTLNQTDYGNG